MDYCVALHYKDKDTYHYKQFKMKKDGSGLEAAEDAVVDDRKPHASSQSRDEEPPPDFVIDRYGRSEADISVKKGNFSNIYKLHLPSLTDASVVPIRGRQYMVNSCSPAPEYWRQKQLNAVQYTYIAVNDELQHLIADYKGYDEESDYSSSPEADDEDDFMYSDKKKDDYQDKIFYS